MNVKILGFDAVAVDAYCGNPKCHGADCKAAEQAITRDQATQLVGRNMLVFLEDVIAAHQAAADASDATEVGKANARLVVEVAKSFGRPLYQVVKAIERPRILRPERSIRIARS